MAPRQFMRKMKVGKTGFAEAYKAVKEYRTKYPDKAVTFFAQQYPQYGWAILMAGGSCPNVPVKDGKFLSDVAKMAYISGEGDSKQQMIGSPEVGYVIYSHDGHPNMNGIEPGTYATYAIDVQDGKVERLSKKEKLDGSSTITNFGNDKVLWLEKL